MGIKLRGGAAAVVTTAVVAVLAIGANDAIADGPCGQDYTGATACAINGASATENGNLVASNDDDYYVFHAASGTHLTVSITDEEDASCPGTCGDVGVELQDAQGNSIAGGDGSSSPNSGPTAPYVFSYIIDTAGTYYLQVSGDQSLDVNGNPLATPYQMTVTATPAVAWPAPPLCQVPSFTGASLATVERRIHAAHCTVGHITHAVSSRRAGTVIALSAEPGHTLPSGAPVSIKVSSGPRKRRRA